MNFTTSIKVVCLDKGATISGRASRSEFWWFQLFAFTISIVPVVGWMLSLLLIFPAIPVAIRRLHDTNRSGWYLLPLPVLLTVIYLISFNEAFFFFFLAVYFLYSLVLLWWFIKKGDKKSNEYGKSPL